MTTLDFIIYLTVLLALKGGSLISIQNVKIGSFRKKNKRSSKQVDLAGRSLLNSDPDRNTRRATLDLDDADDFGGPST